VQDSNLRRHKPSDLQSDPFDRFGNSPPQSTARSFTIFATDSAAVGQSPGIITAKLNSAAAAINSTFARGVRATIANGRQN
jgi:hypothetical protein